MAAALPDYRRILVPLVDDSQSERALDIACRLASEHRASLVALTVIEVPPLLPFDAHMREDEERARHVLDRAEAVGDSYGVAVHGRRVRAREAGAAIVEAARGDDSQLVVLAAPHPRHADGRRHPFGATVETVLRKSPCRVMLVTGSAGR